MGGWWKSTIGPFSWSKLQSELPPITILCLIEIRGQVGGNYSALLDLFHTVYCTINYHPHYLALLASEAVVGILYSVVHSEVSPTTLVLRIAILWWVGDRYSLRDLFHIYHTY